MNFNKDVIEKSMEKNVIVDFYADWCMPCRMLGPVIEKTVEKYKSKVSLVKVNVDEHQDLAGKYNVMSIPSVKMFSNGKVIDEFTGAIPENKIKEWIEKNLK